jgi:protoporphyrinogen oxidase/SAM-dependent methyltransferase
MSRIAIVGGGPGGLFTAYLLQEYCADLCQVTLFEASPRLGGKVRTSQFATAPVCYEAGVAELYDYSHFGPDPVKQLIHKLGLSTISMSGPAVILDDAILKKTRDIRAQFGKQTLEALKGFHQKCRDLCSPADYYEGHWQDDNQHLWAERSFREVLDEIPDPVARKYVEVAARSDLATEPHLTSALNGLKNVLMDDPEYLQLYSIEGGIQALVDELARKLTCTVLLGSPAVRVGKNQDGSYRVTTRQDGRLMEHDFDYVVLCLPNYWLQRLDWGGDDLRRAMQKHLAHYDHPAHYLRISILFREPFWRSQVPGSYFMSDAFGGCCVYDEGARHKCDPHGVLGWLLAGNDAMALSNLDDDTLIDMALDALPAPLAAGCKLFLEGRVHRWVGTINAEPGGKPVHGTRERHLPDAAGCPGLFLVGDYLFDSTINGVYDSADFVTDMLLTRLRKEKYATPPEVVVHVGNGKVGANGKASASLRDGIVPRDYHDQYDGERPYEEAWQEYFCEYYTTDLIRAVWGWSPPYRLLDCGSASGLTLPAFQKLGVEAWGVENSPYIHQRTPARWRKRNLLGDVRDLPFPDGSFDFVYDTCLCHVPEADLERAIRELFRVCRVGVFYGGFTSDMTLGVIEAYDIFEGIHSMFTLWEWSELFLSQGFRIATSNQKRLARAWKIEVDSNEGDVPWYPDAESMRYCFYSKPDAPAAPGRRRLRLASGGR